MEENTIRIQIEVPESDDDKPIEDELIEKLILEKLRDAYCKNAESCEWELVDNIPLDNGNWGLTIDCWAVV